MATAVRSFSFEVGENNLDQARLATVMLVVLLKYVSLADDVYCDD